MRILVFIFLLATSFGGEIFAQHKVTGGLVDTKGLPVQYATVALLYPSDSTLAFFAVSDASGKFNMTQVDEGSYLFQCSRMGMKSIWRIVSVPVDTQYGLGDLLMEEIALDLGEVEVVDEHTPFRMRGDTIEYNSAAYRTGPDDVVEDLLEQLPGVNVDDAGNIKAQGETVDKVLVDGKEFFGSDPKVATRNLPADAIKKVEVYDDLSDEAELTGMEDGNYEKTINLMLKDNAKRAWIGEMKAGYGTDEHFSADAKAYRFTSENQLAVLGMMNNINKFGFTLQDYIDFQGGFRNFMDGNGSMEIQLDDNGSTPVDFGQPVTGLVTSGAGGINYTFEKIKDHRFNASYMISGADKDLVQSVYTENNIPENDYYTNQLSDESSANRTHLINASWRTTLDSTGKFNISTRAGLTGYNDVFSSSLLSYNSESIVNKLVRDVSNNQFSKNLNSNASLLRKFGRNDQLFRLSASVTANDVNTDDTWDNRTSFYNPPTETVITSVRNERTDQLSASASASLTYSLGRGYSLQPVISAAMDRQNLHRELWNEFPVDQIIDSLSPEFFLQYNSITPGLKFRKNEKKQNLTIGIGLENGKLDDQLNGDAGTSSTYHYFLPSLNWYNEYKSGRNLSFDYNTDVITPQAILRMPVYDYSSGLQASTGNRVLRPEYTHTGILRWMIFDQFSFTSFFLNLNGRYTTNKMSWSTVIDDQLMVRDEPVNMPEAWRIGASGQFSTPVRKLGITLTLSADESWRKSANYMNFEFNTYSVLSHELSLKIENRKKDKVRASITGGFIRSESLNQQSTSGAYNWNQYFVNGVVKYTLVDHLTIECSIKWNHFDDASFRRVIDVPLFNASVAWSGVFRGRGTIAVEAFDLMNRNTGIERSADLSYLRETRSDIINQYVLLSFKYRLNKFEKEEGFKVEME